MESPQLFQSQRFKKSYGSLSVQLTTCVHGAIIDLINRYKADPQTFLSYYGRVKRITKKIVIEVDISRSDRLIADVDGDKITLLDVGDHDIVGRYPKESLLDDINRAVNAKKLYPNDNSPFTRLFENMGDNQYEIFANELDPEWLYYLSNNQKGMAESIRRKTVRAHVDEPKYFTIAGGPGTGKTSILLKLLVDLHSTNKNRPVLVVSNELAEHIKKCLRGVDFTGCIIDHQEMVRWAYNRDKFDRHYNILLVDDPETIDQMGTIFDSAIGQCKVVAIAFDPYQLRADLTDSKYKSFLDQYDVEKDYVLTQCYRLKEKVGKTALDVMEQIAASTPFFDSTKIKEFHNNHESLSRIANELKFINPHGYSKLYRDTQRKNLVKEIERIKYLPLWKHTPPLLVVMDERSEGTKWPWQKWLKGIDYWPVTIYPENYSELKTIKGLEFQHVFIVLHEGLYSQLENGFKGTGQREYHRRRLLRIPWSRGKDSLIVFVTDA